MDNQRFKVGQRVQFTQFAVDSGVFKPSSPRAADGWKGTVLRLNGPLGVTVLQDGYKTPNRYHVSFWEPLTARSMPKYAPQRNDPDDR